MSNRRLMILTHRRRRTQIGTERPGIGEDKEAFREDDPPNPAATTPLPFKILSS